MNRDEPLLPSAKPMAADIAGVELERHRLRCIIDVAIECGVVTIGQIARLGIHMIRAQ